MRANGLESYIRKFNESLGPFVASFNRMNLFEGYDLYRQEDLNKPETKHVLAPYEILSDEEKNSVSNMYFNSPDIIYEQSECKEKVMKKPQCGCRQGTSL